MIKPDNYVRWYEIIHSDQVPANELVAIMQDNPKFAEWYHLRSRRQAGKGQRIGDRAAGS